MVAKLQKKVWEERFRVHNKDAVHLLNPDGDFVEQYKDKVHLVYGDVPFGFFKDVEWDRPFSESQIRSLLLGCKKVLHRTGTVIIRTGGFGMDVWKRVGEEVGLHAEWAPRNVVFTEVWSRRKAYL